jgi:HlyD family secretion protein
MNTQQGTDPATGAQPAGAGKERAPSASVLPAKAAALRALGGQTSRKTAWPRWALGTGLLGVGALAFSLFSIGGGGGAPSTAPEFTVQSQPLSMELHEIGAVEAFNETPVVTRFTGDLIWMIPDGSEVKEGDPVVRFETKTVVEDIEQREKDLYLKQEALSRAEQTTKLTEEKYRITLRQQEIELEKAQVDYSLVFNSPRPEERQDVELTLRSAQLDLERSELDMASYDLLARQGFETEARRKEKLLDLVTKKANFVKAKSIRDLTVQGSTPEEKRVAELAVADARKQVNIVRFNRDADLAVCQATTELARVALANFERELARKKQDLDWATTRAPVNGRMVFTEVFKGSTKTRAPIQVGETRMAGSELGMISDTSSLKIKVFVNESNIASVAVGQHARVTIPAFPGRTFEAIVSDLGIVALDKNEALSSLALRRSGEAFVNVVEVHLTFVNMPDEDRKQIKVGFTANVYIQTGGRDMALSLPWDAIQYDESGHPYAEVMKGGAIERRTIKIGRANASQVEVLQGLSDHDIVRNSSAVLPAGESRSLNAEPERALPGGS